MGILEKAAQAQPEGEGKDSRDSRETHKEEMPKHHKKKETKAPSAPQEADLPGDDAGGGSDAESQPNAGPDNAQPSPDADQSGGQDAGPGGASGSDQDEQDQGGDSDQSDSDAGSPDSQPPQGGGQGGPNGGQGGAPGVPNPQAPGAGDDTSGGSDTPTDGTAPTQGTGDTSGGETPGDDTAQGPGSTADMTQIPMSPAAEQELQHADDLLNQALYGQQGDGTATAVLQGLSGDPQHKLRNAIHTSLMLLTELHKQLNNFPPGLVMPFAKIVTAHVLDLGQQVKQIQYSSSDCTAIFGAVYEGIMRIWGVNKGQAKRVVGAFGRKSLTQHYANHKAALAHAKPAMDAAAGAAQQGPPQEAGPQTGAPVGTTASTTSGAPPQPQVPPAQPTDQGAGASAAQGGMLQQAAAGQPS
jgi:hypothetical protein